MPVRSAGPPATGSPVPRDGSPLSTGQHALLAWLLVTLWLLPLVGCQGCWSSNPPAKKLTAEEELEEREKKKKKLAEKPKPDFEMAPTIILPNEVGQDVEDDGKEKKATAPKVVFYIKPGHWVAGLQAAKANNFDFQGELRTFPMDQSELPLDVEHTDFRMSVTRPVSLGKGVPKRLETMFFLPKRGANLSKTYSLRTELRATRSSRLPEIMNVAGNALREHEYYLVVLAKNPGAYVDIAKLDSVQLYNSELGSFDTGPYDQPPAHRFYHAVFPRTDKSVPLPSHPLAWTMIAYIVWDDIDPKVLTAEQQTALLDWLHWGGQLIISGPNSLDRLKQTFLEPYLPATSGKALTIDAARLQPLNENWSVKNTQPLKKPAIIAVPDGKPLVGVELEKHPDAEWLPGTGELAIERRIGNGRIAVTAFSLGTPAYRFWASRDNFFNACLLRRPARQFSVPNGSDLTVHWAGSLSGANAGDPRLGTRLRFFSRDIGRMRAAGSANRPGAPASALVHAHDPALPERGNQTTENTASSLPTTTDLEPVHTGPAGVSDPRFAGYQTDQLSGVAGWNDFSGAAEAAHAALNDASGIKIPRSDFVLKVLLVYLAVLVPLNWLIFWLIGRVEYAWIAAPVIAITGALAVVRLAQLDIGFARSRTEIAILESHGGYPRAHVTRFTALYTSLSTSYDLRFDDPDALALPFALTEAHTRRITRPASDVMLTQDKTIELSDVQVQSNSTGKVHMEQMLSLDAPFLVTGDEARGWQLENGSQFTLRQAGVLRRTPGAVAGEPARVEVAYFPDIEPGATVRLNFQPAPAMYKYPWVAQWDNSSMMSATAPTDDENRVRLVRLAKLATQQLQLLPGEMRLVAWTDQPLPGLRIMPEAAQSTTYTLVVVHLQTAPLAAPESDPRLRTDVLQDDPPADDTESASN